MKTIVVTGGSDGIGKAVALAHLRRGDTVIVLGRDPRKQAAFAEFGERARFMTADLSLVEENRRVVETILATAPAIDALVLCARHYRSARTLTTEGFEDTFALFYLSRFVLSHGLAVALDRATSPVIVNVAGPSHDLSLVHWDDLQLKHAYDANAAMFQGGKLNDLLGVAFAARRGTGAAGRTAYVLIHPGATATSFAGDYDPAAAAHVERMKAFGKPPEAAVPPIAAVIDQPPLQPLSAFVEGRPLPVEHPSFDVADAERLHRLTESLLAT